MAKGMPAPAPTVADSRRGGTLADGKLAVPAPAPTQTVVPFKTAEDISGDTIINDCPAGTVGIPVKFIALAGRSVSLNFDLVTEQVPWFVYRVRGLTANIQVDTDPKWNGFWTVQVRRLIQPGGYTLLTQQWMDLQPYASNDYQPVPGVRSNDIIDGKTYLTMETQVVASGGTGYGIFSVSAVIDSWHIERNYL